MAVSGMRYLYKYNDKLWIMKSRIDKGSDWSDGKDDVVYVKLRFRYVVVGKY
jgi:hypothetical protein